MTLYHLIKDGAFYRRYARGYTSDITEAGVFTLEQAMSHVGSSHGEVTMSEVPPTPIDSLTYWTRQLLAALPAKRDWLDPVIETNLKELTK